MTTTEASPVGLRLATWFGVSVLVSLGLPVTWIGLVGLGSGVGRGLFCGGLVLLVSAAGGAAKEVAERRARRDPPDPRLDLLADEPALLFPRAAGPTLVSSWVLAAYAAVAALGAVFVALSERWGWVAVLVALAAWLAWTSGVQHGSGLAGGLWLTPTRLRHEDRGFAVDVPWESVTGVVSEQPMPVLLRPDRQVEVTRTGPPGRTWRPLGRNGTTLVVDARHLPGGAEVVSYVIAKAVTDRASRHVLGTKASLPPLGASPPGADG